MTVKCNLLSLLYTDFSAFVIIQIQARKGAAGERQCARVAAAQGLRPAGRNAHGREGEQRAESQARLYRPAARATAATTTTAATRAAEVLFAIALDPQAGDCYHDGKYLWLAEEAADRPVVQVQGEARARTE